MDNRHALIVDCRITQATGNGTIGADKTYGTKGMVAEFRRIGVTPHVALNTSLPGGPAINDHTTSHGGYDKSINTRRGIEQGWLDQRVGQHAPVQAVGNVQGGRSIRSAGDPYNLVRLDQRLRMAMGEP